MTVKELINELLDLPMHSEIMLRYPKEHSDGYGGTVYGYGYEIDGVTKDGGTVYIEFTDWRDKDADSD